jgi:peptide/nickel transport system substrate-binding protein
MDRLPSRALAVLLLASLAACGGSSAPEAGPGSAENANGNPQRGDWLVLWSLADPESLNPITSNDSGASAVLGWIFPSLMRLDLETLELAPLIAVAPPEIAEDKLTYTYRLRSDVTYSDGRPLTAHDVVFTVKTIKNPLVRAQHTRNYYESVRDVVAVDDHTVRFDLREPYFRNDLILGGIAPIPRHYYDRDGLLADVSVPELDAFDAMGAEKKQRVERFAETFNRDFHRNPLGPGSFVLADPERDLITGERIVLRHRSDYWAPDLPEQEDAWVDRVLYKVVNDAESALVSFKRGDLDVMSLNPLQHTRPDTNSAKFLERADKREYVSPTFSYIGWNQKRPMFADARVRRALSHFVDKEAIVKTILKGLGVPVESPIFVERSEYNRALDPWPYDPELGKRLLAEAGWSDGDGDGILDKRIDGKREPLRFEIISNSGNAVRRDVGLTVIDEFKRAGIGAGFREIDWSIMLDKVNKFDYDAVILGWAMSVQAPDAYQIWHSSQAVPGGSNHIAYSNPEVDHILEVYRKEFDPERRKELYDRFQEILYGEQPYTFLFMQKSVTTWDRRFRNVNWYPSGGTYLREWWVPEGVQKYAP